MNKLFFIILLVFTCTSFKSIILKNNSDMIEEYLSSKFIIYNHKTHKIVDDSGLCNITFYHLQNSVIFQDNDIPGLRQKYIFRHQKKINKKLKSGKMLQKFIYTCEANFPYGSSIFTITRNDYGIISFGIRDSEYGKEKVYYVNYTRSYTPGSENFLGF